MSQSSSGENRNRSGGSRSGGSSGSRNRSGNRGGNRNRQEGGRSRSSSRRPEPKLTGFQKFVKAITFGLIDPAKSAGKSRSGERRSGGRPSGSGDRSGDRSSSKTRRKPVAVEPTTPRLYVGNLNYEVTDEELSEIFAPLGTVKEATVVRHGGSERSKGFAFVEMGSLEEAKAAVSKLNDQELKGRQMLVTGAKAEKPRREGSDSRESSRGERRDGGRERSEGRSGDRRSRDGSSRERSGGRERKGRGDRGDRIEKPTHQVKPAEVEVITSTSLLVANVNAEATDEDLNDLFSGIGTVSSRSAIDGKEGAATRDFQVEFSEVAEAQKAVELLHGKAFMGNQLKVTGSSGAPQAAPVEKAPVQEAPAEETPAEEVPVEEAKPETPAGEPAVSEAPVEPTAEAESTKAESSGEVEEATITEGEPEVSAEESSEEWSPSEESGEEKN